MKYNKNVLVVTDVDGTINSPSMEMFVKTYDGFKPPTLQYTHKSFDGYFLDAVRVIRKLGWDVKAISASKLGRWINEAFCNYFQIAYYPDQSLFELRKTFGWPPPEASLESAKNKDGETTWTFETLKSSERYISEALKECLAKDSNKESLRAIKGNHPLRDDDGPWANEYRKAFRGLVGAKGDKVPCPYEDLPVTGRMFVLLTAIEVFRIERMAWSVRFDKESQSWCSPIRPDVARCPEKDLVVDDGRLKVLYYGNALRDQELLLEYRDLPQALKDRYPVLFSSPLDAWPAYERLCDIRVPPSQGLQPRSSGKDLIRAIKGCLTFALGDMAALALEANAWSIERLSGLST